MRNLMRWQSQVFDAPIAAGLAILGGLFYLNQSWLYAHTQASVLDEGAYLFGGYLFTTGRYQPFQDFGLWTNHMPLSFLIPGYVQMIFGTGLRTGRILAILLGMLMLIGLWLAARRFSGPWWAAGAVLAVALNPALVKMYSVMTSQILFACMLVWSLVLVLGEERPAWQVMLGTGLAGALALGRLNLIPVLPLVIVYIFWQHGQRVGWWAILVGAAVLVVGHAVYWPGILRAWAAWLPEGLAPFLSAWRPPPGTPLWSPTPGVESRMLSFLFGIRFHFVAVVGTLVALLLWPKRGEWRSQAHFRASMLLAVLFGALFIAHAWASLGINSQTYDALGRNYCVFCFPVYLGFFSPVGILLAAISVDSWRWHMAGWAQAGVALLVLALAVGLGYSAFDPLGDAWLDWRIPRLRTFFTTGQWLPGKVPLWEFLQNQAGLVYSQARRVLPTLAGFASGVLVLGGTAGIRRTFLLQAGSRAAFGPLALIVFLLAGWLLSPSAALGAGYQTYDCGGDVIASYEAAGRYLAERVPPSSKVYWQGGLSAVPLLYLTDIEVYPPQLHAGYTFRLEGESQALLRYGFWNRELGEDWLAEADFILVQERFFEGWLHEALLEPGRFETLGLSPPTVTCRDDARIYIFRPTR
ncbi:MAG TPA: glycosyltransferase family 39 protein [Anaerolineales bacterium]|nr:glycosyltransferase family 39 protein [Anaerolineales bacterium]